MQAASQQRSGQRQPSRQVAVGAADAASPLRDCAVNGRAALGKEGRTEMNTTAEHAKKALDAAEFLVSDLRELHKSLCKAKPTVADKLAEAHVLVLLANACNLRTALEGFQP